jgi:uncharacterized protein
VITLDTSGLLALLDRQDPDHSACLTVMQHDSGPYLIPVAILSEIGWFLERRFPSRVQTAFLEDLRTGAYTPDWAPADVARIERLARDYVDLPLGIADASVIACAERNMGRVLSLDHHFQIVARGEKRLVALPDEFA